MTGPAPGVVAPRYPLLGIWVNALDIESLNSLVADAISNQRRWVIAHHNLHSLRLVQRDDAMRAFYEHADFIHIDGMPLVWLGRLLGHPLRRCHRVTYVDWVRPLMRMSADHGWRVFYLGGRPGVAESGARTLRNEIPTLHVATSHGYFDASPESPDTRAVVEQIGDFDPHVLMVGMGMPRQERWIGDNRHRLNAPIILPAGASFDYFAGAIPTPPRWSGRIGLEWLFRLISEPRRLGFRYIVEPWFLAPLMARELIRRLATRKTRAGGRVDSGRTDKDGA